MFALDAAAVTPDTPASVVMRVMRKHALYSSSPRLRPTTRPSTSARQDEHAAPRPETAQPRDDTPTRTKPRRFFFAWPKVFTRYERPLLVAAGAFVGLLLVCCMRR
jgi:hypothetical protein